MSPSCPSAAEARAFHWEVLLPEAKRASIMGQKPRASVSCSGSDDALSLPLSVGKLARRKKDSGEMRPQSRAELVFELVRLQEQVSAQRVAGLVNRRDYSCLELADKLRADGFWGSVVEERVRRSRECGLVDDARFARAFISSKIYAGWGQLRIAQELSRRGIDTHALPGWPEEFFGESEEQERAFELAARRSFGGKDPYAKAVRFLCGRGFSLDTARRVASRLRDEGLL